MKRKELLLAVSATLVACFVVELATRLVLPPPGVHPLPLQHVPGLLIPHPTRHYAYAPGFAGQLRTEDFQIDIRTNALGLRDDDIRPGETVDILAAGDSFTAGFGVQAEQAWPSRLEAYIDSTSVRPGEIRVVNAAVSGYSLTQIRLMIEDLLHLKPKIVVLGLYPVAYLRRFDPYVYSSGHAVLKSMVPHIKMTDDAFLYSRFANHNLQRFHFWCMENFHMGAHLLSLFHGSKGQAKPTDWEHVPTQASSASLLDELGMINGMLSRRDIGLVVLLVSYQLQDGRFGPRQKSFRTVAAQYCADAGITFFDPVPALQSTSAYQPIYRIGDDDHWSAPAHALVGRELGQFMLRQEWIVESLRRAP